MLSMKLNVRLKLATHSQTNAYKLHPKFLTNTNRQKKNMQNVCIIHVFAWFFFLSRHKMNCEHTHEHSAIRKLAQFLGRELFIIFY